MLVGVFLTGVLAEPLSWLVLYRPRRTDLETYWYCHWQSDVDDSNHWTEDRVQVTRLLGKLIDHAQRAWV